MDFPTIEHHSPEFETLMQTSRILWGEVSYEGLIKRFVHFLKDRAAVRDLSVVAVPEAHAGGEKPAATGWTRASIASEGLQPLTDKTIGELVARLATVGFKTPEIREGLSVLQVSGHELMVAVVGEPSGGIYLIVWHEAGDAEPMTRRGLSPALRNHCPRELLEFVVRQLQCQCTWFGLLDRTQSLLYRDELTGLFNYRYLEVAVDTEMRRAQRFHTGFSLLFIDLDDFKSVNDRFGHLAGSDVLRQVAKVLQGAVREVDSVIRYGGDEYVVVLLGATSTTAMVAAERIRTRIAKALFRVEAEKTVNLTVSIGVASFPEHGRDKDDLLSFADQGMYRGKRSGKNKTIVLTAADRTMVESGDRAGAESGKQETAK